MVYLGLSPVHIILNTPTVNLGLSPESTTLDLPMWSISVHRQYEHFSIRQQFISVYRHFVFLSGACATTDVGRTSRREFTLVREVRTTAVSRRLRKTDWCFYSVFVFQSLIHSLIQRNYRSRSMRLYLWRFLHGSTS